MMAATTRPAPAAQAVAAPAPYGHLSPAERYLHLERDRALFGLLRRHGFADLSRSRIIELGCAEGALLRTLYHHGALDGNVAAVDLRRAPLDRARAATNAGGLAGADAAALPYRDGAFDLAFAFTLLSSITDGAQRRRAAREALRVLRPGGLLAVYDFWTNPTNTTVRPVRAAELRELFAPARVDIERVTLAPPIVRALRGRAALCRPLERLPWLRTHLLAAVVKEA